MLLEDEAELDGPDELEMLRGSEEKERRKEKKEGLKGSDITPDCGPAKCRHPPIKQPKGLSDLSREVFVIKISCEFFYFKVHVYPSNPSLDVQD